MGAEIMLKLEIFPAEGEPFQRTVAGVAPVVVGRSSTVDLMIPDRMLSRRHARFYIEGGEWLVEDLGSHNGTFLNGSRVESPARLKDGDVLALGGSSVTLTLTRGVSDAARASHVTHAGTVSGGTVFRPATEVLRQGAMDHGSGRETDKEALRASLERLRILNEVHQALAKPISLSELLDLILDRAFSHLHPEEGAVYLRAPEGEYRCAASRSARPAASPLKVPRSLVREVGDKGMAALVLDVQTDDRFAAAASILSAGVRSLVAAPLQDAKGVMGIIVLVSTLSVRQFTEEDMELLVSLGAVAALRIRNVALAEEAAEARHLEEELALARRIQLALLPDRLPDLPGYEVHGGNLPSRGVSGDYYEVIERKDGTEAVLWIVDVCGKGMSAALLTASLEALAAGLIEEGLPPEEVFRRVSRLLYQRTPPEKYATAFMAVIEVATGMVSYTNAGHCPSLLVRRGGGCEWLKTTGIPLGLMEEWAYARDEAILEPGDLLMLYTDGITEAMNPSDEEFGTERLSQVASEHGAEPLKGIAQRLESEMDSFVKGVPYADDRTLVIIRRNPRIP
jgi:serine phosphatase RsbU (regulator of sigma subunit)